LSDRIAYLITPPGPNARGSPCCRLSDRIAYLITPPGPNKSHCLSDNGPCAGVLPVAHRHLPGVHCQVDNHGESLGVHGDICHRLLVDDDVAAPLLVVLQRDASHAPRAPHLLVQVFGRSVIIWVLTPFRTTSPSLSLTLQQ
jgi:hypothetical protein